MGQPGEGRRAVPMPIEFAGRVAIVTGSGAGLGRCYAEFLASRGARVLVNDIDEAAAECVVQAIRRASGEAIANAADVVDGAGAMVDAAISQWGRIDIIVCNAGILRDRSFHRMDAGSFEEVIKVHLMGSFSILRAAWPYMRQAGYGRVVLITSVSGLYGMYGQANYSSAKAAMVGLAKTLGAEGEKCGIKVNALAPGGGTAMTKTILPPEVVEKWKPEYVVPCLAFLCAQELPCTGCVFESGGGWMAQVRWQRSPGVFFNIEGDGFTPEDVQRAWVGITDFADGTAPEVEGTATGITTPQLIQIISKL
jgi:NAD(P)-dependent dehydrogenase (short-subunit alcohol dehydrogenase family)